MASVRLLVTATRICLILTQMAHAIVPHSVQDKPDVEECGVRNQSNLWPFHVGLYRAERNESFYFCGGTIVSGWHVIVSAHCVTPYRLEQLSVRYGVSDLSTVDHTDRCRVGQLIVHPDYRAPDFSNDLALLLLLDPIPIGPLAQPVCLWPTKSDNMTSTGGDLAGTRGISVGWGVGPRNFYTIVLQRATTEILRQNLCLDVFSGILFEKNDFFCAVTPVCSGSGGSGFYVQIGERYYLRGITTFGIEAKGRYQCGINTLTGLLNMARYTEWIKQQIGASFGLRIWDPVFPALRGRRTLHGKTGEKEANFSSPIYP
uniref:Peptidase S1 domain-containing protein n=1 Tax=Anopheles farauti TaxID=69004 RepID=A0A182QRG3_9DIPT